MLATIRNGLQKRVTASAIESLPQRTQTALYRLLHPGDLPDADFLTRAFRRLRSVSQFGYRVVDVTNGAALSIHTRLEHSAGVAANMVAVLTRLQTERPDLVDDDLVHRGTMAALFHDLGHGHNSHGFDAHLVPAVANELLDRGESLERYPLRHEMRSQQAVRQAARYRGSPLTPRDALVVDQLLDPFPRIDFMSKRHRIVRDLLSAPSLDQLDVDRIDYLRRDAYYMNLDRAWHRTVQHEAALLGAFRIDGNDCLQLAASVAAVQKEHLDLRLLMQRRLFLDDKVVAAQAESAQRAASQTTTETLHRIHRASHDYASLLALQTDEGALTCFGQFGVHVFWNPVTVSVEHAEPLYR
jgi:HD superfamily phosphohydrolase